MTISSPTSSPFREVPKTGVIYVMSEAKKRGYSPGNSDWVNFGQGAPETGPLESTDKRILNLEFDTSDLEYAPVAGLDELREAVAELYNQRYREGKSSKYTAANVAISSGGRLGLTRVVSTLGRCHVGHFLPDYTAYEELLDAFGTFVPIPLQLDETTGYKMSSEELREKVLGLGLATIIFSNPCNPTGSVISGQELASYLELARELHTWLFIDEFYSHYLYGLDRTAISAAEYVDDVNSDPVVIVDGLTKNWRYPGFRLSWTIGPEEIIQKVAAAGSFLDGGCARPIQKAATQLLATEEANRQANSIQDVFASKKDFLVKALSDLGIRVPVTPDGSFYVWGDLSELPNAVSDGNAFFEKGLEHGLITVPGVFFDINPGHRRPNRPSRFRQFTRFSFGPSMNELEIGVEKVEQLLHSL